MCRLGVYPSGKENVTAYYRIINKVLAKIYLKKWIFLRNFPIEIFLQKNTSFSSLKSVRAENKGEGLGTQAAKHSLNSLQLEIPPKDYKKLVKT